MKSLYRQMTLKTRITVSFVLLMIAVMAFLVVAEQLDYDELRAWVMTENLYEVAPHLKEDVASGIVPTLPAGNLLYNTQTVPDTLLRFAPGYHRLEESEYRHLLVFDLNSQRFYLLQDGERYAGLELLIDSFAPLVIGLCILGAFWMGRLTSARVTVPITRLANAVQLNQKPLPFMDSNDEIGVLARAFAQHSDELERFLYRERCFAGDASHELRTPLAIIAGAAETLLHQLPADSHLLPVAQRAVRTTQEMERQLTCLLLLSRDPHTLPIASVSLRPLIEECMARCQPWLARKNVELRLDAPQQIHLATNAELARSVIWNLLRNACQYTIEGEVRLTLRGTTLTLSDTGPGLPSSIAPHAFQRFQSGSPQHGEGLGLSIVQRIVEHLCWHMTVESSEQGSSFTLVMHRLISPDDTE